MAETNALLKRRTGNRTEGSNPSVSATFFTQTPNADRRNPKDFSGLQRELCPCASSAVQTQLFASVGKELLKK